MDTFGKAVWMLLIAGCACLTAAGCWKTSGERFETYNDLKKSAVERPREPGGAQKADGGQQRLTSAPEDVTPAPALPKTSSARSAKASRPAMQNESGSKGAMAATAMPASVGKSPAAPPLGRPTGAGNAVGAFQASVASPVTTGGVASRSAPQSASQSGRKVQLLVPQRTFKTEGPEGAWRVSYDDIDLLKVLNMDPVPTNAAAQMPGWLKGLDGKRIRIRGFMYPTFSQTGIRAFGLARDNQICCFGRNPKIYDVFDVLLREGVTTDYLPNRPFDVVGVFHIRPEAEDGKLYHLYEVDDATVIAK